MSSLLRFLGLARDDGRSDADGEGVIRRIANELDALEPERARFFAAFAYLLARVAGVDLRIEAAELDEMERILVQVAELDARDAKLVVEIAGAEMDQLGASHNYLVTRAFRGMSSQQDRVRLLHCLFGVAAADDTISGDESNEIIQIAEELGLTRQDALHVRSRFRDKLAELRRLKSER